MIEKYRTPNDPCNEHKAKLFRLDRPSDREALERLLASDPRIEIFDVFDQQVAELADGRNPTRPVTTGRKERRNSAVRSEDEASGVWAFYPWSRRLVHILDEADFVELRTNRNRHKITAEEQRLLAEKRVGVIGLSVGQAASLTMAMERIFGELRIADFDHLGLSNLNRIRAGIHSLGMSKVSVTAREISEIDPYLRITCFTEGLDHATMDTFLLGGGKLDLIIDECDDLELKLLVRFRARELGIPVLMETSDRGLVDVERFDLEPARPIFHGLVEGIQPSSLRGLSNEDKVPFAVRVLGDTAISGRMIASMVEIGQTIETWPQLASAVMLGGGVAGDTARRILLDQFRASGRFYVDLEQILSDGSAGPALKDVTPEPAPAPKAATIATTGSLVHTSRVRAIVEAANAAPSGGNCQPWSWLAQGDGTLWLLHDRPRSASFLDFGDTGAMLALGAAAENAVLAAHHLGYTVSLDLFPPSAPAPRAVARLSLSESGGRGTESHRWDSLHEQILFRHSNRKLGKLTPLPEEAARALTEVAQSSPGARLELLQSKEQLREIASILGSGDRVRFLNQQLHAEMMSEVRWSRAESEAKRDGVDIETLELTPSDRAGISLCRSWSAMQLLRRIGGGFALEKMSKKAAVASSAVGLLTMSACTARDFFEGGRCLQRLWLRATELGLSFQPMSSLPYLFARLVRGGGEGMPEVQIDELRKLRVRYEALFDLSPQRGEMLLFRLSYAEPASARALRRTVDQTLSFSKQ